MSYCCSICLKLAKQRKEAQLLDTCVHIFIGINHFELFKIQIHLQWGRILKKLKKLRAKSKGPALS